MESVLLEFQNVTKTFPGVRALSKVNLALRENEIVGLVGENGAGKSTILNVASGVLQADEGTIILRGQPFLPNNYHQAMLKGVSRVFQEQALVPNLTVYENMMLSHENRFSFYGFNLNRRKMINQALEQLDMLRIRIDPTRPTGEYSTSTRQVIEIAKACSVAAMLGIEKPVILLDEPTAALSGDETAVFFDLIRELKQRASFIFVTHRLEEVLALSDRIYVLKDGEVVSELDCRGGAVEERTLHSLMVGRERDEDYYKEERQVVQFGAEALRVEGLTKPGAFRDVTFTLGAGEVLGIGGVLGSGKSELARAICGADTYDSGEIWIYDEPLAHKGIKELMKQGIGYIPQERHLEGVILNMSVAWNITLASMGDLMQRGPGIINVKKEKEAVQKSIEDFHILTPSSATFAYALSGGNQQKVVLAKWLLRDPRVLVMDNPTFGIDVGNKAEVYTILRGLAERGVAILLISDELLELIGLSNRILVMKDGVVANEIAAPAGSKPTEADLVAHMV